MSEREENVNNNPEACAKVATTGSKIIIVRSSTSTTTECQRINKIEPEKDSLSPSIRIGKGNSYHNICDIFHSPNAKLCFYIIFFNCL